METSKLAATIREACGIALFSHQSANPKRDAQRNLAERTHYVDPESLRFHKSRILGRGVLCDGLLFYLVESVAATYNGSTRDFRVVLFDVFGETIERPKLNACERTQEKARKAFWTSYESFDVRSYYAERLAERITRKRRKLEACERALATIQTEPEQ